MSRSLAVRAGSELGEILLGFAVGDDESSLQRLADEIGLPRTTLRHVIAGYDMTRETEGRIFAFLRHVGFELRADVPVTLEAVRAMHPCKEPPPAEEPEWLKRQIPMFG